MSIERIEALKGKHSEIDSNLHLEKSRPSPDEATVNALKKQKLALKDEIASLVDETTH